MSGSSADLSEKVRQVIRDYVRPNGHLLTMQRIHEEFTGEGKEFQTWNEVLDEYSSAEWTDEKVGDFVSICKRVVDGQTGLSETYFSFLGPESPDELIPEFEAKAYSPDVDREAREGFMYDRDGNTIEGRYIYVDIDTEISHSGDIRNLLTEGSLEFTIDFDRGVLILHSTSVVDVQKARSIFRQYTNMDIHVFYDASENPTESNQLYQSFVDHIDDSDEIDVIEIQSIKFDQIQSEEQSSINSATFHANFAPETEIEDQPDIKDMMDNGWFIKSITLQVDYHDNIASATIASTSMMCYLKVENTRIHIGKEIQEIIRGFFFEDFGDTSERLDR